MGIFRFKRLPFGLSLSQDVFQQQMDTMLQNTEGIINIADDIIVFGTDQETHDKNLEALMIQAEKYGLVFNATKCNISKDEVSFFGQLYNKDGIRSRQNTSYRTDADTDHYRRTKKFYRHSILHEPIHK